MRLGTNHFHSDGGRGWDFTVSEILHFNIMATVLKHFFSRHCQSKKEIST